MERAVPWLAGSRVELEDLPEEVRRPPRRPSDGPCALEDIEKDYILAALKRTAATRRTPPDSCTSDRHAVPEAQELRRAWRSE